MGRERKIVPRRGKGKQYQRNRKVGKVVLRVTEQEIYINTRVPKLLFTSVCAGGVYLDPFIYEYFPEGILVRNLHHMLIHTKQPYISRKNNQKMFRFKMAAKKRIFAKKVT